MLPANGVSQAEEFKYYAQKIYELLAIQSDILQKYIVSNYEAPHYERSEIVRTQIQYYCR